MDLETVVTVTLLSCLETPRMHPQLDGNTHAMNQSLIIIRAQDLPDISSESSPKSDKTLLAAVESI